MGFPFQSQGGDRPFGFWYPKLFTDQTSLNSFWHFAWLHLPTHGCSGVVGLESPHGRILFKFQHKRIPSGFCKPHPLLLPGLSQQIFSKKPFFSQLNSCILGMDWLIDWLLAGFISHFVPTLHSKQQRSPVEWSWGHFQLQALFLNFSWIYFGTPFFPTVCNSTNPSCWGHKGFFKHSLETSLSQFFPARMFLCTGISQQELSGHGSESQIENVTKISQI